MTQGDQQHPSGMTGADGAGSSCPKDADAVKGGSSSPQEGSDRIAMEGRLHYNQHPPPHHHHTRQHLEQTTSADGDVKTLLHFVSLASSDIKAALDKSAPSTARKSSSADSSRKYPQRQLLKKSPTANFAEAEVCRGEDSYFSARRFLASSCPSPANPNGALHFSERLMASASLHRDHLIKSSDLLKEFTFGNTLRRDPDQLLLGRRGSVNRYTDRRSASSAGREFTDMSTLVDRGSEGDRPDNENPVPLRKRRLPASFWQEPERSENHKTTPVTMTGLSPVNLSSNLKFPSLLSSVAQGFADSRPTSLDKNAIYPSSDHCFSGLTLPFPPLSNTMSSDNYLNRSLNFQCSSICSCNQHADMYSYEHGPACAAYMARHGGETSGIFNPVNATGLLSRWHAPPQFATERASMCQPSTPRVVKPIPTKSITSYPPRYHPIYT